MEHYIKNNQHQDWTETKFDKTNKYKVIEKEISKRDPNVININKLDNETDVQKHKTVSHSLKMQIQSTRLSMKLTQKDLANKLNLPVKTISDYESGRAIPNPNTLNKIKRVLHIKTKK
jgi:ribosome-binding protein aMBF1 (putative translation factor)